jgi:hypothetical protein
MKKSYKLIILFLIIALVFTTIGLVVGNSSYGYKASLASGGATSGGAGVKILVQKPTPPATGG